MENKKETVVVIETTLGTIKVKLYNDTPLHRDNFIKLVKEGFYNDLLFHRVIKNFMIQGGDPESKNASAGKQLGVGGPGYTLPAEIKYPERFHKRGALSAACQGDEVNPEKKSSGSQFYIVWGEVYSDGKLDAIEKQLTQMQEQKIFHALAATHRSEIINLRRNRDQEGLYALQEELIKQTQKKMKELGPVRLTAEQRQVYKTVGGTPHLDGDYTVFGEVKEGLDVVEKIQQVQTGNADRPVKDIRMNMKIEGV